MKPVHYSICILIFLCSLSFMSFQCGGCREFHDRTSYSVNINSSANTFSIGDTLVLSTILNAEIDLELSETLYDNSNQPIKYRMYLFEGQRNNNRAVQARDHFDFFEVKGEVFIPEVRTWEIDIENTCDEDLCELEFGIIPQKKGYFGLFLRSGNFGFNEECQYLSLYPAGFKSNGSNNFEIFEEIDVYDIFVNGLTPMKPEGEESRLHFFKVVD